ncbi:MAG: HpcH/HpaI aldolase/citrate lyase family protein [Gaiellales bacterium]
MHEATSGPDPLISMLFVPGSDQNKLGKIVDGGPDSFILDLEDSVAWSEKARAREMCAQTIDAHGSAEHLYVRVNPVGSRLLLDDLEATVRPGLAGVQVPKVESARDVQVIDWVLGQLEARQGMAEGSIRLLPTLETARGIGNADEVAVASPRTRTLAIGLGDLGLDMSLAHSEDLSANAVVTAARVAVALAARRARLEPPHDSAYTQYQDEDGLRREAAFARSLGFVGKHAIHPLQVPVIHDVFRPTEAEVARAEKLVAAFDQAERDGTAAVGVDGELVDYPIAWRAMATLRLAGRMVGKDS